MKDSSFVVFLHLKLPPSHDPSFRNPLGLPISKRDSLLEKCTMFREAGAALSRHASQDNGLDGPFSSGTSKVEQVSVCPITNWSPELMNGFATTQRPNSVCVCDTEHWFWPYAGALLRLNWCLRPPTTTWPPSASSQTAACCMRCRSASATTKSMWVWLCASEEKPFSNVKHAL